MTFSRNQCLDYHKTLEERGAQGSWLIRKDNLLETQG